MGYVEYVRRILLKCIAFRDLRMTTVIFEVIRKILLLKNSFFPSYCHLQRCACTILWRSVFEISKKHFEIL